jgi:hypothetical protein
MCANKVYPITFKPEKTTAFWRMGYFLANRRDHCVCGRESIAFSWAFISKLRAKPIDCL